MQTDTFSNEQLAGQRLMVGFEGTELNEDLKFLIGELKVGGVILFSINIEAPDQLRKLCRSIQDYAAACRQPPMFIAVDQEGGQVARLKEPFTIFPGNPHIKSDKDAVDFAEITAAELHQVGINMNMAPVMDVSPEGGDSVMAGRTFGGNPSRVARLGVKVIKHLQQNNIMAVAKHFPGIGRTTLDSHLDMPVLHDELSTLELFDLIPFEAGIQNGVSGVMLSHIVYTNLDPAWPASLSPPIASRLLRQQMGFNGLVLTDDLDMGAITRHYDIHSAIQQILAADIDLSLICHKGPNIEIGFKEILKGITENQDLKAKGVESAKRIFAAKKKYLSFQR
jgi:beta-N-acetylhexosaminidase